MRPRSKDVSIHPPTWYFRAREQVGRAWCLHDQDGTPAERLLQAIWFHQRLLRDRLQTTDGRKVQVVHPGFPNPEGGPDFRDALVRLGDGPVCRGDVEVDVRPRSWWEHGHDRNPRFARVLLHVVWEAATLAPDAPARGNRAENPPPPILPLCEVLDAPLPELALWLDRGENVAWPEALRGACCAPLRQLDPGQLEELLEQAAAARLEGKILWFQARARAVGWEQALWEGLFRGLGYKHNTWPMQWLAEHRCRWAEGARSVTLLQARLLGLGGLLPDEIRHLPADSDQLLRRLWDLWWRDRATLEDCCLPRNAWRLHGVRPANHPQRRLALVAHWLARPDWVRSLEIWCTTEHAESDLAPSLLRLLQPPSDPFWSWHWTVQSTRLPQPQPLIGEARVTDLAVNVILPWLAARARTVKPPLLWERLQRWYFAWPAGEDNALLRLARQRLLAGRVPRGLLRRAATQQGLLQIVRDFCDHANAACEGCPFPARVREWAAAAQGAGKED